MSRGPRVTESDLRQAVATSFRQRLLRSPTPPAPADVEPAAAPPDVPPGCAVPTASGGICARPGVLADPQTGRYRCLYHVHTLGEVS